MKSGYQIVVCGGVVPDPLQILEPIATPNGPMLRNESLLPAVLDPWASHALYEAGHLAQHYPGSRVILVSLSPKQRLQQVMMTIAQKLPFELVPIDGSASGFTDPYETACVLADAIKEIAGLDRERLLVFGGWESASRGAGVTLQYVAERLGIADVFLGVDELHVGADGSMEVVERMEGGRQRLSRCASPPVVLGWATGKLPEPRNNPQIGMQNMRGIIPGLQRAKQVRVGAEGVTFASVSQPKQVRQTRIVRNASPDEIAREIVEWIRRQP
ncbi:MAG: electron transfer flavoprotein subunit beta [Verrucomicrobiae bacterium]|nr:electron transfer flavoprotein subunit beta [Verrucomicrobiae bacterium]